LIAVAAVARGLPFYTRSPHDFAGIDGFVVVAVS
jgi:hypothetical protein